MNHITATTPFPRSYWVIPGLLLVGEYPGAKNHREAQQKLERLVDAGIQTVINLMETDETDHSGKPFNDYAPTIARIAAIRKTSVACHRFPIGDLNVPTAHVMDRIQETITESIEARKPVYVHCWGGIGRTGTTVGCFLLSNGMAHAGNVLNTIADLRKNDPKKGQPSPETPAQRKFVTHWLEGSTQPPTKLSRSIGCMLGGAVGDALGAPVEFLGVEEIHRRYGRSGIAKFDDAYGRIGAITDDTQMAMFTADGLLRAWTRGCTKGICNPASVVHHAYVQWLNTQKVESKSSFNDSKVGRLIHEKALWSRRAPGNSCLSALMNHEMGTIEEPINDSKGCGGVMRAAPVGLIAHNVEEAFTLGCEIAAVTHGHPTGHLAAGALAVMVYHIYHGRSLHSGILSALSLLEGRPDHSECSRAILQAMILADKQDISADDIQKIGEGWVAEEALAISLLCVLSYRNDFDKAVKLAVNHGGDSDSTGAITGNIMGCLMGRQGIASRWTDNLELADVIQSLGEDLFVGFQDARQWWDRYPGY